MIYNIKAWIMCPPEYVNKCTKYCKARTKFTLALKVFFLQLFYDYVDVVEEGGVNDSKASNNVHQIRSP